MRTKTMLVAGLLLIAALVLVACAPVPAGAPAPAATEAAAGEAAAEGAYAGVDPSGQTVVWWHNHSGRREENLLPLIEEYNQSNAYGITVEAQNQGTYDDIREKVNASIAAGEVPAALVVGYQNDQARYQVNDTLVEETAHRIAHLRATPEAREGIGAFLEKRSPNWMGE